MTSKFDHLLDGNVHEVEVVHREPERLAGRPRSRGNTKLAYYEALPAATLERFTAFLADEDYLSLEQEIAAARALMNQMVNETRDFWTTVRPLEYIERGEKPPAPPYSITSMMSALETVGKLVERQHKLLFGDSNTITVEAALAFVLSVGQMVSTFVSNVEERQAIFDGLRAILLKGKTFDIDVRVAQKLLSREG